MVAMWETRTLINGQRIKTVLIRSRRAMSTPWELAQGSSCSPSTRYLAELCSYLELLSEPGFKKNYRLVCLVEETNDRETYI